MGSNDFVTLFFLVAQLIGWLAFHETPSSGVLWGGACILLGRIAIGDWLTALVGIVSLAVLFRWKVSNPLLIAATAVVGLVAYPILQPGWVMVH